MVGDKGQGSITASDMWLAHFLTQIPLLGGCRARYYYFVPPDHVEPTHRQKGILSKLNEHLIIMSCYGSHANNPFSIRARTMALDAIRELAVIADIFDHSGKESCIAQGSVRSHGDIKKEKFSQRDEHVVAKNKREGKGGQVEARVKVEEGVKVGEGQTVERVLEDFKGKVSLPIIPAHPPQSGTGIGQRTNTSSTSTSCSDLPVTSGRITDSNIVDSIRSDKQQHRLNPSAVPFQPAA